MIILDLFLCALIALSALHFEKQPNLTRKGKQAMKMELKSAAFKDGGTIPGKFTCDGPDVSPALSWTGIPAEAKSLALICDDPDAPIGTWVHWVIYNIPATASELAEAVPKTEILANGALQGKNDFRKIGYGGPCPPRGPAHRYFFKIYALDTMVKLNPGATKKDLLDRLKNHILAEAQLLGKYGR